MPVELKYLKYYSRMACYLKFEKITCLMKKPGKVLYMVQLESITYPGFKRHVPINVKMGFKMYFAHLRGN